uniref:Ovule protein n=1 Tax=Heterorhabditis bacteriophora TaxID=37862 RepID=A0A1I7XS47_HETBA
MNCLGKSTDTVTHNSNTVLFYNKHKVNNVEATKQVINITSVSKSYYVLPLFIRKRRKMHKLEQSSSFIRGSVDNYFRGIQVIP